MFKMKRLKIVFVFFFALFSLALWKFKIAKTQELKKSENFEFLDDCRLPKENPDKNIFFIETSGVLPNFTNTPATLTTRQACSVESAALTNPNAYIFVIFVSKSSLGNSQPMIVLKKLKNVIFLRLNLIEFTRKTPVGEWIRGGKIYKTHFLRENVSNILKVLLLWKYGGFSLDLDVFSQIPIDEIKERNFIVAEYKNPRVFNAL
jgi:Glycosyltransferase sugar-binding region containing DXD motif